MYTNQAKDLNKDPLYRSAYRTRGYHVTWDMSRVVFSVHGDTMSFFTNRIEDTVGDAPQESLTG